ncbi:hypothetical protein B0A53_04336 [Rhodotorula sp. CCFEE 5036]|nr:hypothetical protein B0A53_04336 [Rhodotorula sp. CCFEE 5036]
MVNPCALNPCYLFFKLACGWVCTIKGWVVLESLLLAAQYFAAAWAIRRVVFPILKGLFENVLSYQVLHGPVHDWIDQIKIIFYGCMIYVAVGVCGALGAIFEIMILLWIYALYLIGTAILNAKTIWSLLQSVLAAEEKFGKACNFYSYAGAGFVLACQLLTLVCVLIQIRRIHKKTKSWLFTFCGKGLGRKKHHPKDEEENALEKEIPDGRRRRRKRAAAADRPSSLAQRSRSHVQRIRVELPPATFDLPRKTQRRPM